LLWSVCCSRDAALSRDDEADSVEAGEQLAKAIRQRVVRNNLLAVMVEVSILVTSQDRQGLSNLFAVDHKRLQMLVC
jgi:hypothetical protein